MCKWLTMTVGIAGYMLSKSGLTCHTQAIGWAGNLMGLIALVILMGTIWGELVKWSEED